MDLHRGTGRGLIAALKSVCDKKGFKLYERPYELNIIGIRSPNTTPNAFDDRIVVFYKDDKGETISHVWDATTDPGTYWLNNPIQPQGTAILAEGQYVGAYVIGLHLGKYSALVQRGGMVTILRDYNRDAVLDFSSQVKSTGYFGINIHHANSVGITKSVDKNSAGCQVLANVEEFNTLMK